MRSRSKEMLIRGPVLAALIAAATLSGLVGCASSEPKRNVRQSPPPEWFEARQAGALRDFYGYQARRRRHERELADIHSLNAEQWQEGENRRVTARGRVIRRKLVSVSNFFELQARQEAARSRMKLVNLEGRQAFIDATARNQERIGLEAEKKRQARLETLRIESERRRSQVGLLQRFRRNQARVANIPLAQVRGLPPSLQRPRQTIQPAAVVVPSGTGAPVAGSEQTAAAGVGAPLAPAVGAPLAPAVGAPQ